MVALFTWFPFIIVLWFHLFTSWKCFCLLLLLNCFFFFFCSRRSYWSFAFSGATKSGDYAYISEQRKSKLTNIKRQNLTIKTIIVIIYLSIDLLCLTYSTVITISIPKLFGFRYKKNAIEKSKSSGYETDCRKVIQSPFERLL